MKPIRNHSTYICGCNIVKRTKKNGRLVRITEEQHDQIDDMYETYNQMCAVNKDGSCREAGCCGHTKLGVHMVGYCKKCGREKMVAIAHKPFRIPAIEHSSAHVTHFPIPIIRRVTTHTIETQNGRRDDGYDDYGWDEEENGQYMEDVDDYY